RMHLGAEMRAVGAEVSMPNGELSFASAESMAGQLIGHMTSPSQAAMRRELQDRLRAALDEMDPLDREVLALRHFEELGNSEVAAVLGISKDAASKRHVRALKRLRDILGDLTGPLPTCPLDTGRADCRYNPLGCTPGQWTSPMSTDHNLLLGVLALQADLLDAARFAEACSAWAARKEVPLADLLVERGWLTPADRSDVDK